jgi:hypothetical protein
MRNAANHVRSSTQGAITEGHCAACGATTQYSRTSTRSSRFTLLLFEAQVFDYNVFMKVTFDLPDKTCSRLKAEAALRGVSVKELVAQYIERGLNEDSQVPAAAYPRRSYAIPIAREVDGSVTPALRNSQLQAILEGEDLAEYHRVMPQRPPA